MNTERIRLYKKPKEQRLEDLDIQFIVAFKEENFFFRKTNKINIFKVARDKIPQISSIDHLIHQKFSFKSIAERN